MKARCENKQMLFHACMHVCACMDHKRLESRHSWHLVMSPHNLLTSHLHPSVTHRGRIRWTASITWQCTLFLQALFQGNQIWSTQFPSSVCTYVSVFWAVVSMGTRKLDLWPMKRDAVYPACRCQKNKWKKNPYFKLLLGIATITCMKEHHMYSHRAQKAAQDEPRQGSGKSQKGQPFPARIIHLNPQRDICKRPILLQMFASTHLLQGPSGP